MEFNAWLAMSTISGFEGKAGCRIELQVESHEK
jgi:hypothetical protein